MHQRDVRYNVHASQQWHLTGGRRGGSCLWSTPIFAGRAMCLRGMAALYALAWSRLARIVLSH